MHHAADGSIVGDIREHADRFAAAGADTGDDVIQRSLVAMAVDHHPGAGLRERFGHRAANVAARAGNQRDAAVEAKTVSGQHVDLKLPSPCGGDCGNDVCTRQPPCSHPSPAPSRKARGRNQARSRGVALPYRPGSSSTFLARMLRWISFEPA